MLNKKKIVSYGFLGSSMAAKSTEYVGSREEKSGKFENSTKANKNACKIFLLFSKIYKSDFHECEM